MDGSKARGAKIFSLDQGALWVEALVPGLEGLAPSDVIRFQAANIEYIRSVGPYASMICLMSGANVTVKMPQAELVEKIQNHDGAVLDLKSISYVEPKAKILTRLQEEFKKAAADEKFAPLENMTFQALVRAPNQAEFREVTFCGQDVDMRAISEGGSILGGKNIRLSMKNAEKAPFEGTEFIIEGTLDEFRALCAEAYARGDRSIDLREFSRQKADVQPEPAFKDPRP